MQEAGAIRAFTDTVPGAAASRPELERLIDHARPGDRLVEAGMMNEERNKALAIARLEGDRASVRAEMQAMEARIDAGLAQLREDLAKRDTRLLVVIVGTIVTATGLATAVLSLLIRWPGAAG